MRDIGESNKFSKTVDTYAASISIEKGCNPEQFCRMYSFMMQ
jgi:hypothetical protein